MSDLNPCPLQRWDTGYDERVGLKVFWSEIYGPWVKNEDVETLWDERCRLERERDAALKRLEDAESEIARLQREVYDATDALRGYEQGDQK